MDDLKQLDLYALLGVPVAAKTKEIKTAYRKKALTCHPDKNPDDPQAVKLFHQLKKALELLLDDTERAAYDKLLKAREANKARNEALDSHRKKMKTDLEERERRAFEKQSTAEMSQKRLERLKKQTFDEMSAEAERVCKERAERANEKLFSMRRIRIRWKVDKDDITNGGYNVENLTKIFSKYGEIEALVISNKKKGSALLEFNSPEAAKRAQTVEIGHKSNPLTVNILGIDPSQYINVDAKQFDSSKSTAFPQFSSTPNRTNGPETSTNFEDFKAAVFRRMKEAQAKKNLVDSSNE